MILNNDIQNEVKKMLSNLNDNVELAVFTQKIECQYCEDNRTLMEEIAGLSDKISIKIYDYINDNEKVKEYKIDKIPAVAVIGKEDYHIRFFGIPAGYEFTSLIEAIKLVSTGETTLSKETESYLKNLDKDVHLQVFVTPTCPYCPQAVILAHQMARISKKVRADMIETTEFPQLGTKYNVMGVPRTIINESFYLEGAVPDNMIIEKIKEALK